MRFLPLISIFLLLNNPAHPSLLPRARFNGEGQPRLGLPSPAVRCDSVRATAPPLSDCEAAIGWISGTDPANGNDADAEDALQRVRNTIVEFLSPAAERRDRLRPAVRTPAFWRYGNTVYFSELVRAGGGVVELSRVIELTGKNANGDIIMQATV